MFGLNFLAYGGVVVLAAMSPGPDFLIVTKHATTGRRPGLAAGAGVAGGMAVNTAAALLGLGAVFLASPGLYAAVRIIAALYLIYLGAQALIAVRGMLRAPAPAAAVLAETDGTAGEFGRTGTAPVPGHPRTATPDAKPARASSSTKIESTKIEQHAPASSWTAFRQGLLTNFLNPKVVVFLLTLMPQFMSSTPSAGERLAIFVVSVVAVLLYFSVLALLLSQFSRVLQRPRVNLTITAVTGVALVLVGTEIAVSSL